MSLLLINKKKVILETKKDTKKQMTISSHGGKLKNTLTSKCYFLRRAHSTEQTSFMRAFPSGTHFTAESTEAAQLSRLKQHR